MFNILLTLGILYLVLVVSILVCEAFAYWRLLRADPYTLCQIHSQFHVWQQTIPKALQVSSAVMSGIVWPLVLPKQLIENPKFRPWWMPCRQCAK